jgi:hypothetical protein
MGVSRRLFLRCCAALAGGAGLAALTARQAAAKIAPNLVAYQDKPMGDHDCSNCKLFVAPDGCRSVDGKISPSGWCKMWIKA